MTRAVCVCVVALLLLLLLLPLLCFVGGDGGASSPSFTRDDFPKDFVFGASTSAYQVEGAAAEDGRTPSIMDTFTHAGYSIGTADVTADGYHKYKEDVKLMAETGLEAYRFSISWSRLIPNGRGEINPKGLEYYNNLIDELLKYGIQPHVTLFHYDLPQSLEDEYGGWLSPNIVDDFTAYADVCFREFGDRVSHWTTLNEPNVFVLGGYDLPCFAPRRCSFPFVYCPLRTFSPTFVNCSYGDSTTEPYIAAHNSLLAHNSAASLYKKKYQAKQQGFIGLNVLTYYFVPATNSAENVKATERAWNFYIGWFVEPLIRGDYPETMKEAAGTKMKKFSSDISKQLMNSFDFIGINYYSTLFVRNDLNDAPSNQRDAIGDQHIKLGLGHGTPDDEVSLGYKRILLFPQHLRNLNKSVAPQSKAYGLQGVLEYFKQVYGNPSIYIHENGYAMPQIGSLDDTPRMRYLSDHLGSLLNALRNGSNTLGYFVWSFMDVFEILSDYEFTYGLYYVDFSDKNRKRYPRLSATWYSAFLRKTWQIGSFNSSPFELPTSL